MRLPASRGRGRARHHPPCRRAALTVLAVAWRWHGAWQRAAALPAPPTAPALRVRRYGGVGGTLDELFATDDPDPRGKLRRLLAEDEKRRGQRASKPSAAPAERLQQLRAQA